MRVAANVFVGRCVLSLRTVFVSHYRIAQYRIAHTRAHAHPSTPTPARPRPHPRTHSVHTYISVYNNSIDTHYGI